MRRAISWVFRVAAALCVATCGTHSKSEAMSEAESEAEGPPPPARLAAAPPSPPAPASLPNDPPPAPQAYARCPAGMVLVEGEYCTDVRQDCATWKDPPSTPLARCAQYSPEI